MTHMVSEDHGHTNGVHPASDYTGAIPNGSAGDEGGSHGGVESGLGGPGSSLGTNGVHDGGYVSSIGMLRPGESVMAWCRRRSEERASEASEVVAEVESVVIELQSVDRCMAVLRDAEPPIDASMDQYSGLDMSRDVSPITKTREDRSILNDTTSSSVALLSGSAMQLAAAVSPSPRFPGINGSLMWGGDHGGEPRTPTVIVERRAAEARELRRTLDDLTQAVASLEQEESTEREATEELRKKYEQTTVRPIADLEDAIQAAESSLGPILGSYAVGQVTEERIDALRREVRAARKRRQELEAEARLAMQEAAVQQSRCEQLFLDHAVPVHDDSRSKLLGAADAAYVAVLGEVTRGVTELHGAIREQHQCLSEQNESLRAEVEQKLDYLAQLQLDVQKQAASVTGLETQLTDTKKALSEICGRLDVNYPQLVQRLRDVVSVVFSLHPLYYRKSSETVVDNNNNVDEAVAADEAEMAAAQERLSAALTEMHAEYAQATATRGELRDKLATLPPMKSERLKSLEQQKSHLQLELEETLAEQSRIEVLVTKSLGGPGSRRGSRGSDGRSTPVSNAEVEQVTTGRVLLREIAECEKALEDGHRAGIALDGQAATVNEDIAKLTLEVGRAEECTLEHTSQQEGLQEEAKICREKLADVQDTLDDLDMELSVLRTDAMVFEDEQREWKSLEASYVTRLHSLEDQTRARRHAATPEVEYTGGAGGGTSDAVVPVRVADSLPSAQPSPSPLGVIFAPLQMIGRAASWLLQSYGIGGSETTERVTATPARSQKASESPSPSFQDRMNSVPPSFKVPPITTAAPPAAPPTDEGTSSNLSANHSPMSRHSTAAAASHQTSLAGSPRHPATPPPQPPTTHGEVRGVAGHVARVSVSPEEDDLSPDSVPTEVSGKRVVES